MDKKKYYKILFLIGGFYNLIGAILLGVLPIFFDGIFPFFGITNPNNLLFVHIFTAIIASVAVGYFMLFKDLSKNRGLVIVGAAGRAVTFIIAMIYLIQGECNWLFLVLLSPDIIQAVLYIEFLINYKRL